MPVAVPMRSLRSPARGSARGRRTGPDARSPGCGESDHAIREAVARARGGDRAAHEYLYLEFAGDVQRYVRGIVVQPHDAEDITQNVFIKLLGSLDRYEERESPFSAWLMRVARNAALDHLRRQRAVAAEELAPSVSAAAEHDVERADSLQEAFETLPGRQRLVLFLRHVVGLSPGEIAARIDKTERAVRNLHYRGRGALEAELRRSETTPATLVRDER